MIIIAVLLLRDRKKLRSENQIKYVTPLQNEEFTAVSYFSLCVILQRRKKKLFQLFCSEINEFSLWQDKRNRTTSASFHLLKI